MTIAFEQNESDPSYFKVDAALPETIRTKPTTRTKSVNITSVHRECVKHGVDLAFNQKTAACHFINYYICRYRRAGRYPMFKFKANIG